MSILNRLQDAIAGLVVYLALTALGKYVYVNVLSLVNDMGPNNTTSKLNKYLQCIFAYVLELIKYFHH